MSGPQQYIDMLQSTQEEERLQGLKGLARAGIDSDLSPLYLALGDESWRVRKEAAETFLAIPRACELAGEIVALLHAQDNAGLRNTAVEILISLGRRAVPVLLSEMASPDRDVRKFLLDILGEIGDQSSADAMIEALQDVDENVRAAAAENLGKMRARGAVPALLESLRRPELLFRFTVLEALGQIGSTVPVGQLLAYREEQLLRKALVDCLGRVGGTEAVPFLFAALSDPMRPVREAALLALGRIGFESPETLQAGFSGEGCGQAAEFLGDILRCGRMEVRQAAIRLVGICGNGDFARLLLQNLETEELREAAAAALISLGKTDPAILTSLWPDADEGERACLAFLFGEAECESAAPLLEAGMTSENPDLRGFSVRSLGRIGREESLPCLARVLSDSVPQVQEAALQALRQLGSRYPARIGEIIAPLCESADPQQRKYAVALYAALPETEVEARLGLALKDEAPQVRGAAIRAIGGQAGSRHLPALVLVLTDEDAEVRRLAVEVLGMIGDVQATKPLELALADDDPWVRAAAVQALGNIEGGEDLMTTVLEDPVGLVVIAALEILATRGGAAVKSLIMKSLSHPDEEVVRAALQQLSPLPEDGWIDAACDDLLRHSNSEVRLLFVRLFAERRGAAARGMLEKYLLVEEDEFVRQQIRSCLAEIF